VVAVEVVVVIIETEEEGEVMTEATEIVVIVIVAVAATNDILQVGLVLVPILLVPDPILRLLANTLRIEEETEKEIAVAIVRKRRKDEIAMLRRVLARLLPNKNNVGKSRKKMCSTVFVFFFSFFFSFLI
jgi:hypothetical protein